MVGSTTFVSPNGDLHLEVKTTKREGRDVDISSISQLDEVAVLPLCLIGVRVRDIAGRRVSVTW